LGALLDGVMHGLRQLPSTSLKEMPRMADFALWATACETAFWKSGTFAKAYKQNRDDALGVVIEADQSASAVQKFMEDKTEWKGTTSQLLVALKMDGAIPLDQTKLKEWPQTPEKLSRRLQRCAATLRRAGIEVTRVKATDRGRARIIKLAKKGKGGNRPNRPNRPNSKPVNDLDADSMANKPSNKPSEASFDQPSAKSDQPSATVQPDPCKSKVLDGSDGSPLSLLAGRFLVLLSQGSGATFAARPTT